MSRRYSTAPRSAALQGRAADDARRATSAAARAAGRAGRRRSASTRRRAGVTTRPGAVPTGSRISAPAGITACLRLDIEHRRGIEVRPARHERAQDLRDAALERLVEHHLAALELADHGGRQVVGRRPEAAARADQLAALGGEEAQRAQDVLGPVADDRDGDRVGAELEQLLGQPRAVAIQDAAGEHLGAGDDDPRPDAHGRALTGRRRAAAWPTAAGAPARA